MIIVYVFLYIFMFNSIHSANDMSSAVPLLTQKSCSEVVLPGLGLQGSITLNW